ncbi:phage tail sheath subtilisin-like domain-containing protein [Ornithinimicrobium pekingense]|uniref:Uncharacterized protein n=1 Tax=Ornithinimicrobium pekingense TaxID=384677 RepID=A0ABQ2F2K2_9MICO|nr:phage tail sheath subtilisin-like domain-containing protein [Ornithinimicrobium pekingense]GGK55936.1 hypothetical protein GCM10011509_00360 [Ornithinimicrobium pekingense]
MQPDPSRVPVQPVPEAPAAFVGWTAAGPVDTPVRVTSVEDYRASFGTRPGDPEASPLDRAVELFFAGGGTDAVVVGASGPTAGHVVPPGGVGGLAALREPFSLLVLPGLTTAASRAVSAALARCEEERAVLLLDLPADSDARTAGLRADRVDGPRDRVAVYHPWLLAGGATVAPSGAVAGVVASTSARRGVADTPAGDQAELRGADGLALDLAAAGAELLAAHGVNALRDLPDRRRVVWGGRLLAATEATEPSGRFLAVRRLTDHVLSSLEAGMAFVAGRRTDPGLADLVRVRAEDFLTELWRTGALAGVSAQEAFFVRCDGTTTPAADLAAGRMVLRLGLATVRPSEFEVHDLVLSTAGGHGPEVLAPPVALARAADLARERLTVVRREDLAALTSGHLQETERRLARVFDSAAHAGTVLVLEEADAVLGRDDGAGRRHGVEVVRLLDRLSRETDVPYVLARRP